MSQKNSLKNTGFTINNDGFTYRGNFHPFSDVTALRRHVVNTQVTSVGYGTDSSMNIGIGILLKNGDFLQVSEKNTMLKDSNENVVQLIEEMFLEIQNKTFKYRLLPFLDQISTNNTFDWGTYIISTKDQSITSKNNNKTFLISECEFSKIYGGILFRNKNKVIPIYVKLTKFLFDFPKPNALGTTINHDILLFLLRKYFDISWSN
jgi:hypothetical protein